MRMFQLVLAAACFAVGGVFMKTSAGGVRLAPTLTFLVLFAAGAWLQAIAMRQADMGAVYIAVLGIEAALALGLSVLLLGERLSALRLIAAAMIVLGVALLRRS